VVAASNADCGAPAAVSRVKVWLTATPFDENVPQTKLCDAAAYEQRARPSAGAATTGVEEGRVRPSDGRIGECGERLVERGALVGWGRSTNRRPHALTRTAIARTAGSARERTNI
jgi:hypothetical protein